MIKCADRIRFGDFVKVKRLKEGITLKTMAKKLHLSIAYWSDIENNRRNPINDKLEMLIKIFDLSTKEQHLLYDLAGKARKEVSPDLLEYIMDWEVSPYVRSALRKAKQNIISIKDWKRIIEELDKIQAPKFKHEES